MDERLTTAIAESLTTVESTTAIAQSTSDTAATAAQAATTAVEATTTAAIPGIHIGGSVVPYAWAVAAAIALLALIGIAVAFALKKRGKSAPVEVIGGAGLRIGNLHNIGKRDSQQDAFGISDLSDAALTARKGVLAVVADGIGGLTGGAKISSIVTSHFLQGFPALPEELEPCEQLLRLTLGANDLALLHAQGEMSGSTVVAVLLRGQQLHFVSVGDSRIYLLHGGALVQLTREHTLASQLDEDAARGLISVQEARSDRQRGSLTSYIGMENLTLIDRSLKPIQLSPGDKILLMTDGVFGTLSEDELLGLVTGAEPFAASQALEQAVLDKAKPNQDNFTAIILEI